MSFRTWQWISFVVVALIMTYEVVTQPSSIYGVIAGVLFGGIGTHLQLGRIRGYETE